MTDKEQRTRPTKYPTLILGAFLSCKAFNKTGLQAPSNLERHIVQVSAMPDTGQIMYLTGSKIIKQMGIDCSAGRTEKIRNNDCRKYGPAFLDLTLGNSTSIQLVYNRLSMFEPK